MTKPTIFIYCDDPSHPERRSAVTNFTQIDPTDSPHSTAGRWNEVFASSAAQGQRESGTTLIDDGLLPAAELRPGVSGVRSRYSLQCRKCRKPVVAREDKLFAALNEIAATGVASVSLAFLAASVQRIDAQ